MILGKKGSETVEEKETKQRRDPVVRFWLALLRGALILGLLFYLLYHLTSGFSAEMKTQTVRLTTEEQLLGAVGTVVRAEVPIPAPSGGVISYHFADGEKVKAGARIAMVASFSSAIRPGSSMDTELSLRAMAAVLKPSAFSCCMPSSGQLPV